MLNPCEKQLKSFFFFFNLYRFTRGLRHWTSQTMIFPQSTEPTFTRVRCDPSFGPHVLSPLFSSSSDNEFFYHFILNSSHFVQIFPRHRFCNLPTSHGSKKKKKKMPPWALHWLYWRYISCKSDPIRLYYCPVAVCCGGQSVWFLTANKQNKQNKQKNNTEHRSDAGSLARMRVSTVKSRASSSGQRKCRQVLWMHKPEKVSFYFMYKWWVYLIECDFFIFFFFFPSGLHLSRIPWENTKNMPLHCLNIVTPPPPPPPPLELMIDVFIYVSFFQVFRVQFGHGLFL